MKRVHKHLSFLGTEQEVAFKKKSLYLESQLAWHSATWRSAQVLVPKVPLDFLALIAKEYLFPIKQAWNGSLA